VLLLDVLHTMTFHEMCVGFGCTKTCFAQECVALCLNNLSLFSLMLTTIYSVRKLVDIHVW
jgi:hypothetical protein